MQSDFRLKPGLLGVYYLEQQVKQTELLSHSAKKMGTPERMGPKMQQDGDIQIAWVQRKHSLF